MIPRNYITEWKNNSEWHLDSQTEQDLIISRAIVEIFNNKILNERLAFRGGTALHKIYLKPQSRYSEDIDLVQIKPEPISEIFGELRKSLYFLGDTKTKQSKDNCTAVCRMDSEIPPIVKLKLKIEINCREHSNVLEYAHIPYEIKSEWFKGKCIIRTYQLEELLGTKLRALYQRNKGRDLYDLFKALTTINVKIKTILECYKKYMINSGYKIPSKREFIDNIEKKMSDKEFLTDITALLKPGDYYDSSDAYLLVKDEILDKL